MVSSIVLPKIGLGCNYIGGHNLFSNVDEQVGYQIVETALANEVSFFDTAYVYGFGRSEEIIGDVLARQQKRAEVVLATKAAHQRTADGVVVSNDPAFLTAEVDNALRRLQTDYIDLFYIHFPDQNTPKAEAVGALQRLKEQGKIRAIGLSNFSAEQLQEANIDGYVDIVQGEYNLLNRTAEQTLFPILEQANIGFIPYFPLASGILAGGYTKDTVFTDGRSKRENYQGERFVEILDKVETLRPIAAAHETEIANVVLAYYLTHPQIVSVIPGAKRPAQIEANKAAATITLTAAEKAYIATLF